MPIRSFLRGHIVRTAAQEKCDTLRNGDLREAAEGSGFDLLLTTDKNLRYQQNLKDRRVAIIVLGKQQWPNLRPHVQLVVDAVSACAPGSYTELDIPD